MAVPRSVLITVLAVIVLAAACSAASTPRSGAAVLRLGYVTELTQAAAIVGTRDGLLRGALGPGVVLRLSTFSDDSTAAAALSAGTIDAAYLDPTAAYGVFSTSPHRNVIRVVAGGASGGAMLVTRDTIGTAADLRGRTVAVPRLDSAQAVALRTWLGSVGLGAEVTIVAVDAPTTLAAFSDGAIDGAWLPEPWASRLVTDGGGRVLVDERALWPGGAFSSAVLAVGADFGTRHPDIVRHLVRGHVATVDLLNANPAMAQRDASLELTALTGQDVTAAISAAWARLRFIDDPLPATLQEAADHARPVAGPRPDLRGFVDLSAVNAALRADRKAPVGQ